MADHAANQLLDFVISVYAAEDNKFILDMNLYDTRAEEYRHVSGEKFVYPSDWAVLDRINDWATGAATRYTLNQP